ncbi:MAG: glycoside hydrolase family 2 TIM barrel-domain containing protein [Lachnospiraceae bacterium]|nr:glycoside hydrolase family 2 TIM barrel-domain containing protein [Lachnospiraceae bacterium]
MKYNLNKPNYYTFGIFEDNKLPGRSYFIPYPSREEADAVGPKEKRYRSKKVICLNGDWDFKFYPLPSRLPSVLDTEAVAFDKIDVPSCWQFRGYDRPFYVNLRYQFPYNPPEIPTTKKVGKVFSLFGVDQGVLPRFKDPGEEYNFVGVYRKTFEIDDPDKNYVISFLGVASCLDLYLNGIYVGYSEGSHNTAEFDLTELIRKGENELVAVVHRWCNGTYLECQDMFRNNGIFRDVLLRITEPDGFWDIDAKTKKVADKYALSMSARVLSDTKVTFTLKGKGIEVSEMVTTVDKTATVTFENLSVEEWNAENPVLYDMYFETAGSCVKEKIGFKNVRIKYDLFFVNGKKVKFHGVNHHDTSPTNGYTLTPDEIERDLLLCREYNIDTIRTSHYPPDPLLLELADEMGIYIVDENDLETHGVVVMQVSSNFGSISHDPAWKSHYLDRIKRLYERDKIHANTSIIMWSLGNESGGYSNTDAMYEYLKERTDLPVHYESVIHSDRIAYDVGSEMYPTTKMVHDVGEHKRKEKPLNDRPYFLCEYAHAMGVGPGNMEAYWEEIYHYDNLMGGCVWEMVDHAVLHEDGSYTYGGDHGEWEHDGNFCVDGIFYPDRTPSTGAKIVRYIYRPIRVKHVSDEVFEFFNATSFTPGRTYRVHFKWNDGTEENVRVKVDPLSSVKGIVPVGKTVDGNLSANVTVSDTRDGRVVSEETIIIKRHLPEAPDPEPVTGDLDMAGGIFELALPNGRVLSSSEQYTILYRAGTDNDVNLKFQDVMEPFYAQEEEMKSCERTANGFKVVTKIKTKKGSFIVTDTYEGTQEGILVTSHLHHPAGLSTVPRFGKCFRLDEAFDQVSYTGRMGESYCDMKEQFPIGDVSCLVSDMTEPNIRPQESGNRCDCTVASVSDGQVTVTFRAVDKPFELGIKPYTDKALIAMRHREDEVRTGTYVTIQAFQQGIGTGSCGPETSKEYKYPAGKDYELKFLIKVN